MNKSRTIRRWKIPNRFVIASAGKKDELLILKPLEGEADRHLTLVIKQNGYTEVHLTKEKPYTSRKTLLKGQINFDKLKNEAERLYKRSIKPIRKDDKRYKNFLVLIPKNVKHLETILDLFLVKNDFVYPTKDREEIIEKKLEKYFDRVYFDELLNDERVFAFAFSSRGNLYYLFLDHEKRYLFPIAKASMILMNTIDWNERLCTNCESMVKIDYLECPVCDSKLEDISIMKLKFDHQKQKGSEC